MKAANKDFGKASLPFVPGADHGRGADLVGKRGKYRTQKNPEVQYCLPGKKVLSCAGNDSSCIIG